MFDLISVWIGTESVLCMIIVQVTRDYMKDINEPHVKELQEGVVAGNGGVEE